MVFTSDLTTDEAMLIDALGLEPVELVSGSCYYHVGYTLGVWSENYEMQQVTAAMSEARRIAMYRMYQHAVERDADGVLGVALAIHHHGHHTEFVVRGTAVRAKRREDAPRFRVREGRELFTCDLSGQDVYALFSAGFRPCRIVMGNCVYHVAHQSLAATLQGAGTNYELVLFTRALYDARELAMARMQTDALRGGATGVVGVRVDEGRYGWQSHVLEFLAVGTAVAPWDGPIPAITTLPVMDVGRR